jgi:dCTP deaminase
MIINTHTLIEAAPLEPLLIAKHRYKGLSHGLAEAGYDIRIKQAITLHPFKRFALASSIERFQMPPTLVGIVHDKSTHIRRGLVVGNSVVEPGWEGWLTLELFYHGWKPLHIPAGAGIAQVIFHQIANPASYFGKYQNQNNKPVPAKIDSRSDL